MRRGRPSAHLGPEPEESGPAPSGASRQKWPVGSEGGSVVLGGRPADWGPLEAARQPREPCPDVRPRRPPRRRRCFRDRP
eukprot:3832096-Pyramimonas_sp.AAC.1